MQGDYAGARPDARPGHICATARADRQGPTGTYAGAKPGARPDAGAQRPAATSKVPKGTYAGAANPAARQKLNPQTAGARDRGYTAGKQQNPLDEPQKRFQARSQQDAGFKFQRIPGLAQ